MKYLMILLTLISLCLSVTSVNAANTGKMAERVYLSGKGVSDAVNWQFICDKGRKCGKWSNIPVPSNWEQHGFGNYNYGHDLPEEKHDEIGTYKTTFFAPEAWKNKHVRIIFEGSMTETTVYLNGEKLGVPNLGGYVPFRHDLTKTKALKYNSDNELTVVVAKKPSNDSLDQAERKADYWVLGGIYRPVYLEIQNKSFINRVAIDAKADGSLALDVFPQLNYITKFKKTPPIYVDEVYAQIFSLDGKKIGQPMSQRMLHGSGRVRFNTKVSGHKVWSPEYPNLYQVQVELRKEGQTISQYNQRFGFRTFELKPQDGFYLNGKKLMIKGVNRNVFDPYTGRAIDREKAWKDAEAIKSANMNLVRSHLPPTTEFMEACDELGLLVITELTNWHDPWIDTPIARNIAYELVTKYQNHPSVILWANGNESGFNLEIDDVYHLYDLQDRPVIHPWTNFEDIETFHYPEYAELLEKLAAKTVYLPTEFLHGLYDGGHGAGLQDYWDAMLKSPTSAGGVLWCWADAAISRTDMDGILDTHGNKSSDGIVGPNGEKEASFYTVRHIWSPIQIKQTQLNKNFTGKLTVQNDYYDTHLNDCQFRWRLIKFSRPLDTNIQITEIANGQLKGANIAPGQSGELALNLPNNWLQADALELTGFDPHGREVMTWSFEINKPRQVFVDTQQKIELVNGDPFKVKVADQIWHFSENTGQLISSSINGVNSGLNSGPLLYAATANEKLSLNKKTWKTEAYTLKNHYIILAVNDDKEFVQWTIKPNGTVTLDYQFAEITQPLMYLAVGFNLPEHTVKAKTWLGHGPYRVWANRLKGAEFGLWENEFNDKITGINQWGTPEFKGIFSGIEWLNLKLNNQSSILIQPHDNNFIGVLRPSNTIPVEQVHPKKLNREHESPIHAVWNYPEAGGLHIFHKLPGIGTKFMFAEESGPQGQPKQIKGKISGHITFQLNN